MRYATRQRDNLTERRLALTVPRVDNALDQARLSGALRSYDEQLDALVEPLGRRELLLARRKARGSPWGARGLNGRGGHGARLYTVHPLQVVHHLGTTVKRK